MNTSLLNKSFSHTILMFFCFLPISAMSQEEFSVLLDEPRDPTGEKAHYIVDQDRGRTSSVILEGSADADVQAKNPATGTYGVALNVKIRVKLQGWREEKRFIPIEEEVFQPDFLVNLRESKYFEGENLKIAHQGFATVRTLDGKTYENCDKILLYDFRHAGFSSLFSHLLRRPFTSEEEVDELENARILAHVKYGVPVLGAVKLDVSGKSGAFDIKIGLDLQEKR